MLQPGPNLAVRNSGTHTSAAPLHGRPIPSKLHPCCSITCTVFHTSCTNSSMEFCLLPACHLTLTPPHLHPHPCTQQRSPGNRAFGINSIQSQHLSPLLTPPRSTTLHQAATRSSTHHPATHHPKSTSRSQPQPVPVGRSCWDHPGSSAALTTQPRSRSLMPSWSGLCSSCLGWLG